MTDALARIRAREVQLEHVRAELNRGTMVLDVASIAAGFMPDAATLAQIERERASKEEAQRAQVEALKARLWREKVNHVVRVIARRTAFNPRETEAVQAVRAWFEGGCVRDLVLRGGVGSGKSRAAAYGAMLLLEPEIELLQDGTIAESLRTKEPCVSWLRPNQLVSAIEHAYDPNAPKLRRYVFIDDWGRETRPDFDECLMYLLDLDDTTILATANMNKEEMRERYASNQRLLSRLNERAIAVDIKSPSMRPHEGDF